MDKLKFLELNKEVQEMKCTIPQAVFVTLNPDDETFEQVVERQEKFLKLSEKIKDKLVAPETSEKIKNICAHYNLELLQMAPVARVIRSYYFGEVKLEEFAQIIKKESGIGKEEAQNITRYITERIINKDVEIKNTVRREKLTIVSAMNRYPEIKKQALTASFLETGSRTVNPTVENWINDYFMIVGAGNRDVMKRSSYLYHGKNTRGLSAIDRQKLSQVLKSLDEGFLLDIDIDKKEIFFNFTLTENKKKLVAEISNKKDEQILNQKTIFQASQRTDTQQAKNVTILKEAPRNEEDTQPANNKRFVDGFSAADKKEEDKIIARQVQESIAKLKDINVTSPIKKESGLSFLAGTKKREEFDKAQTGKDIENGKKNSLITSELDSLKKSEVSPKEKKITNEVFEPAEETDKKMAIKHVQGNSWELGSRHFLKKEDSLDEISEKKTSFSFFRKKDKAEDGIRNNKSLGTITFTSPQQLPVEKENNENTKTKDDQFKNFFGRIKPLE